MNEQQLLLNDAESQLATLRKDMAALHEADSRGIHCKFGVSGGVLYRSWSVFSGVQRFLYSEDRKQVCNYIINKCKTLKDLHDFALAFVSGSEFNSRCKALILLAVCKETAATWLSGLNIILAEYPEDFVVVNFIAEARKLLEQIRSSSVALKS